MFNLMNRITIVNKISTLLVIGVVLSGMLTTHSLKAENKRFNHDDKTYEIVEQKMNWENAAKYAREKGGYLVEINSQSEQDALYKELITDGKVPANYTAVNDGGGIAYVWIGGNDISDEGIWLWDGNNDGQSIKFWTGQGANGTGNGASWDNNYQNWGGKAKQGSANEPDDFMGQQDAAAIALDAWPKGAGFLGSKGEWNDINDKNELYFVIEYDYADVPAKPNIIDGISDICPNIAYEYLCNEPEGAAAYEWIVNPESAADIVAQKNFASITWKSGFAGSVSVQVRAINPLGYSEISDEYQVVLKDLPAIPAKPQGDTNLIPEEIIESTYTVDEVPTATEYEWVINPENAGEISQQGKQAIIKWNQKYEGEVLLAVKCKNDCGVSDLSQELMIMLEPQVSVSEENNYGIKVFPNPAKGEITISNLKSDNCRIEAYDMSGKLIKKVTANTKNQTLLLEQSGVYIIKILDGDTSISKKIIVE